MCDKVLMLSCGRVAVCCPSRGPDYALIFTHACFGGRSHVRVLKHLCVCILTTATRTSCTDVRIRASMRVRVTIVAYTSLSSVLR